VCAFGAALGLTTAIAEDAESSSRTEEIQQEREKKAKTLKPPKPGVVERQFLRLQDTQFIQRFGQPSNGIFPKLGGLATGQGMAWHSGCSIQIRTRPVVESSSPVLEWHR
jgi:hypothetical protein